MSIKKINVATTSVAQAQGLTRYSSWEGLVGNVASEADKKTYHRTSSDVFSKLFVRVSANTLSGSATATFRVNGADGNQTITVGAGTTGTYQDSSGSDSVSVNDYTNIKFVTTAGSGSITWYSLSVVSSPSSNVKIFGENVNGNIGSTTNIFRAISGRNFGASATEQNAKLRFKTAGTAQKCQVTVSANTSATNMTYGSRKNGANGNILVTITASTTGDFEDNTNTDSLSVNDEYNFTNLGATVGSVTAGIQKVEFLATDASITPLFNSSNTTASVADGVTRYGYIDGPEFLETTESNSSIPIDFSYTVSTIETYVLTNATTSNSTMDFRVGGATPVGAPSVTITSGTTGYFTDTTSYTGTSGDLVNVRIVNGGGGALAYTNHSILMNEVQSSSTGRANRLSLLGVC